MIKVMSLINLIIINSKSKMRHPAADEPVTDQIFRYFNEMDWSGQSKAKWISIIIQTIAAVSTF